MGFGFQDGDSTKIQGSTDGTLIGNSGDALRVTAGSSGQKDLVAAEQVFSVTVDSFNLSSSSVDNPILLIKNPSLSGKDLYILDIFAGTVESSVSVKYQTYSNPTITADGTSQTIVNRTIKSSPAATVMTAYTGPTVSASGARLSSFVNGQSNNSVTIMTNFQIQVEPGNNLLITGKPSSNNRTCTLTVVWSEEFV